MSNSHAVRKPRGRLVLTLTALFLILAVASCIFVLNCDDGMARELCAGTAVVTLLFIETLMALLVLGRLPLTSAMKVVTVPLFVLEPPPKSPLSA